MKKIAIIGAGISGLFIANLFKKNPNYQVTIYEKKNSIDLEQGYGVQLSVNSIKILNEIGFQKIKDSEKFSPEKINFYSNKNFKKICELNITDFNSEDCKYTTLKRSSLINFLKEGLAGLIKTGYDISKIDQQNKRIKLFFKNNKLIECDYLIISDGVFSKSKSIISKNEASTKYNNTLAIRGNLTKHPKNIDNKNIALFLGSDFHYVIYPVNPDGEYNFIAIIKYSLSEEEQKNRLLFDDKSFIKKVLETLPSKNKDFLKYLKEFKIFPIFVSKNFYKPQTFAQGASQSIEGAYELFKSIENKEENNFFRNRVNKTKMVNTRSKLNQFAFHLSNPLTTFARNILLKRLVKNKKFLENYLGKIYR